VPGLGVTGRRRPDVTQDVLLEIARKMRDFHFDPAHSFRAWLKTLAHGAWCDYLDRGRRHGRGSGDSEVQRLLQAAEAPDDLARKLAEEYERQLLEEAIAIVRPGAGANGR